MPLLWPSARATARAGLANMQDLPGAYWPGAPDEPDRCNMYGWINEEIQAQKPLFWTNRSDCNPFYHMFNPPGYVPYEWGAHAPHYYAYCAGCPANLTHCTSPSTPPPSPPPPPSEPPLPPGEPPAPPPFPPPPLELEPVWLLPRDQCGWSGEFNDRYPYVTGAAALQGCLDFGCTGLANASFLNSSKHRYAVDPVDKPTLESERCYAAWYIDDVEDVSSPTYFMRETPSQACGSGLGSYRTGTKAVGRRLRGCPHIHMPFPPPSPPPPSPPPPTPPPFPPAPEHPSPEIPTPAGPPNPPASPERPAAPPPRPRSRRHLTRRQWSRRRTRRRHRRPVRHQSTKARPPGVAHCLGRRRRSIVAQHRVGAGRDATYGQCDEDGSPYERNTMQHAKWVEECERRKRRQQQQQLLQAKQPRPKGAFASKAPNQGEKKRDGAILYSQVGF